MRSVKIRGKRVTSTYDTDPECMLRNRKKLGLLPNTQMKPGVRSIERVEKYFSIKIEFTQVDLDCGTDTVSKTSV